MLVEVWAIVGSIYCFLKYEDTLDWKLLLVSALFMIAAAIATNREGR